MIKDVLSVSVMYHGRKVGTLSMGNRSCCQFEYDHAWLREGFSISPLQLPLKPGLFSAPWQPFSGNFGIFEDSLPGGYGEYLLRKVLRREGIEYGSLTPVQRLSLVGSSGMGALCYIPESKIGGSTNDLSLDEMQTLALEVLSERTDKGSDLLLFGSGNSGGARPKCLYSDASGHWLVKFRHTFDPTDIGQQEYHYNELARKAGVEVPEFRLMEGKYFATRRFDIDEHGNRLHGYSQRSTKRATHTAQDGLPQPSAADGIPHPVTRGSRAAVPPHGLQPLCEQLRRSRPKLQFPLP